MYQKLHSNHKQEVEISISPWSVLKVIGVIIALYLLWAVKSVVLMFFVSFILASTLRPLVDKAQDKFKLPRTAIIGLIFSIIIFTLSGLTYYIASDLTGELKQLANEEYWDTVVTRVEKFIPGNQEQMAYQLMINKPDREDFGEEVDIKVQYKGEDLVATVPSNQDKDSMVDFGSFTQGTGWLLNVFSGTFGTIITLFTVLVVAFYMLQRRYDVYDGILAFVPVKHRHNVKKYAHRIEHRLGSWMLAQIVLMFTIGFATYFGLAFPTLFLDSDIYTIGRFALALALIAGLLEIIPNIGPALTFVIAAIISIATGGDAVVGQTVYIAIFFMILQQVENVFIVPKIIKKAVGIDPIVTILGVIAASTVFGIAGAVLIIPVIAMLQILAEFVVQEKEIMNLERGVTTDKTVK